MSLFFDGAQAPGLVTNLNRERKEPGGVVKRYHGLVGAAELRGPPGGHDGIVTVSLFLYENWSNHAAMLTKLVEIDGWVNRHGEMSIANDDDEPSVLERFPFCTFLGAEKAGPYLPPGGTVESWSVDLVLHFRQLAPLRD